MKNVCSKRDDTISLMRLIKYFVTTTQLITPKLLREIIMKHEQVLINYKCEA